MDDRVNHDDINVIRSLLSDPRRRERRRSSSKRARTTTMLNFRRRTPSTTGRWPWRRQPRLLRQQRRRTWPRRRSATVRARLRVRSSIRTTRTRCRRRRSRFWITWIDRRRHLDICSITTTATPNRREANRYRNAARRCRRKPSSPASRPPSKSRR